MNKGSYLYFLENARSDVAALTFEFGTVNEVMQSQCEREAEEAQADENVNELWN